MVVTQPCRVVDKQIVAALPAEIDDHLDPRGVELCDAVVEGDRHRVIVGVIEIHLRNVSRVQRGQDGDDATRPERDTPPTFRSRASGTSRLTWGWQRQGDRPPFRARSAWEPESEKRRGNRMRCSFQGSNGKPSSGSKSGLSKHIIKHPWPWRRDPRRFFFLTIIHGLRPPTRRGRQAPASGQRRVESRWN